MVQHQSEKCNYDTNFISINKIQKIFLFMYVVVISQESSISTMRCFFPYCDFIPTYCWVHTLGYSIRAAPSRGDTGTYPAFSFCFSLWLVRLKEHPSSPQPCYFLLFFSWVNQWNSILSLNSRPILVNKVSIVDRAVLHHVMKKF